MTVYASRCGMTADAEAVRRVLRAEIVRVGWSETARRCGMDRTALHRVFRINPATRCPNFATIASVAQALNLEITVTPKVRP